ncbi:hypothetical protein [Caulobacter rhizosphaerae]|jgi:hypothetical protein|uniref:hypothetical protein n=1 Tax=Caulobacter rhizosphaerae TaxID=2010972 RepID=UPI0013D70813|nr:hypothetical protein [Caulobacter rhizosphaerae]GGL10216.1 hypothetical protein GCM10010983_04200 [Caulobacter rhizosphaerae]
MRHLLAFLAILALLISPVTAAAAQVGCAKAGPEAMAMPMAQSADGAKASHDPCCDENQKSPHDGKSCAQICAAMCATIAALPTSDIQLPAIAPMRLTAALSDPLRTRAPPRDERPPKLIA